MKIIYTISLLLILLLGLGQSVFSQVVELNLDTFQRTIPTGNFGGQTWRGPSWVDSIFNDSVATMYPDVLAYPPSPDIWDWENGWFYPQGILDTCCLDSISLNWGQLNANVIDITPENFQSALNQIGAEGLYCLNMISSDMSKQLSDLQTAKDNGVIFERIRLGDEMEKLGNELSVLHFPTAQDYAAACDIYIDSIRNILPNSKIAVSAGNFGSWNTRAQYWNDELYNMTNKADAFRWSAFFYLKDNDTIFNIDELLAYPFDQIPTYEAVRGFNDTTSNLQDYELWVGYSITDNTSNNVFLNRWSLILMFSASHHIFLKNKLVEDISMFNVGGIFQNWDALDTDNNFRKRATGIFASIWNKAKLNKYSATKIKTPNHLIDTVTYYNNNNIPRELAYPKLFGWRFENDSTSEAVVILTNISEDTLIVSLEELLVGDVFWEKWYSDSLFHIIDSINYINTLIDTGLAEVMLLPYSINIASGSICNELSNNSIHSICDGDSVLVGIQTYTNDGFYIDTLNTIFGCDSIVHTNISINNNTYSYDTLSINIPIEWNGMPLDVSDDYSIILINSEGCDSIANLNLTITTPVGILKLNNKLKLVKITNILGQETPIKNNTPLFYLYDDGSIEKKVIIE